MQSVTKEKAIEIASAFLIAKTTRPTQFLSANLIDTATLVRGGFVPKDHRDYWVISFKVIPLRSDFDNETWEWLTEYDRAALLSGQGAATKLIRVDAESGDVSE